MRDPKLAHILVLNKSPWGPRDFEDLPPPLCNLIPDQMALGSGTQTELLELTQKIDLLPEVMITPHFLLPLKNVFNHFKLTPYFSDVR